MRAKTLFIALLAASVGLCSCNGNKADETEAETTTAAPEAEAATSPPPASQPAADNSSAIQSQPGPKGSTVNLVKCRVNGQILNVEFQVVPAQEDGKGQFMSVSIPLEDVYCVDDATVKKAGVLQDNSGNYLANPIQSGAKKKVFIGGTDAMMVSFKFPAPPESSQTVSISVPEFGSFDGVAISK